jgi:hypothetical protein
MIEIDSNHCQVVARSLAGTREVDEQTFTSVAVLGERLERLKRLDKAFAPVQFSRAVEKLQRSKTAVAVG